MAAFFHGRSAPFEARRLMRVKSARKRERTDFAHIFLMKTQTVPC